MSDKTYIVVFPSQFAENKINLLMKNIKKNLKNHNENFTKITRDGNLILVDANDPVFASSTIGLLFGIEKIVIAKQINNDFKNIVSEITKIGSSLLLKGEKFYVSVDGIPKGYMTKDVELSATSSLIENNKIIDAVPGTKEKHDKLLFTYITKSNAYVSIFNDSGLGGTVNNSQSQKIVCAIFDEFSAITCLEAIKQGFEVKIVVFYKNHTELVSLVKILQKILPRTLEIKSQIDFHKINYSTSDLISTNFLLAKIISQIASIKKISCVSLPISPLFFPSSLIKKLQTDVFDLGLVPLLPLSGINSDIFENLKEIGLEKHIPKIEKIFRKKIPKSYKTMFGSALISGIIANKKTVIIEFGPNMLHNVLDSLKVKH